MTPQQVELIRESFGDIWPVRQRFAEMFYGRFFELAPEAQGLFPADMERQHSKLMDMIAALIGALDQRDVFQSLVRNSGQQHLRFGVKPTHFPPLGEALIWSMERQFGEDFTTELKGAWIELYTTVQQDMLQAAWPRPG